MNDCASMGQKVMLLSGTPTRLPGTSVEVRWDLEDNAELLKRRPPTPLALVCAYRLLSPVGPTALDGPTLRRARERARVSLRRVAATSGLSYGFLSNVERSEPGRPVNPGVLAAYRRAGVALPGVAVGVCPVPAADEGPASLLTPAGWWRTRNNDGRGAGRGE